MWVPDYDMKNYALDPNIFLHTYATIMKLRFYVYTKYNFAHYKRKPPLNDLKY